MPTQHPDANKWEYITQSGKNGRKSLFALHPRVGDVVDYETSIAKGRTTVDKNWSRWAGAGNPVWSMVSRSPVEESAIEPEPFTWKEIEQVAFKGMLMFYGLAFLAIAPLLFVFIIKSVW